jgi:Rad3-related DNA helicase
MIGRYALNFPDKYTPSTQQAQLLKKIEKAYSDGYKFVICSAPTGSGKSFISKTLGNISQPVSENLKRMVNSYEAYKMDMYGNFINEVECLNEPPFGVFALTITKSLQDQYLNLFSDSSILKGKTNYRCEVDYDFDVETAPCIFTPKLRDECWCKNKCTYYNARNQALTDKFSVLNYKMFLTLPKHLKRKNFIICDEASELEDEIVKQYTIYIDIEKLNRYGIKVINTTSDKPELVYKWLNNLQIELSESISTLTSKISKEKQQINLNDRVKLQYLKNLHRSTQLICNTWNDCEYVIYREPKSLKLLPLKVDTLTKNIFDYGDNVLLMSATIIDHKNFTKILGIKPEEYKYIEVDSTFDASKAPIYVSKTNKLNHSNLQKALPGIVDQINEICSLHKNEKGVIHTHTGYITEYLKKNLPTGRFLYRDDESTNEVILREHNRSDMPTVLVSPSLSLGIDLKDNLARFQIIVKAAFLPLNDLRIKKLFEQNKEWYENKMLSNFVQQCGRGIRSKQDHCITYVLDSNIYHSLLKSKHKLPKYFLDRFV